MSERAWLLHVRQSVFTKLVAIMVTEARRHERGSFSGRHYYVTSAPNGGTY